MKSTETGPEGNSSEAQDSSPKKVNLVIGIGIMGDMVEVERFAALWIIDCERRAHRINEKLFQSRLQLLPADEANEIL